LVLLITGVAGVLSGCEPKSIDKYWQAQTYSGEDGEVYVRIYGLTKEGKKQESLVLPKYIAGCKVGLLLGKTVYPGTAPSAALFGNVKYVTIEGHVSIGKRFFMTTKYPVVEFLSKEPPIIEYPFSQDTRIFIVPDGSPDDYLADSVEVTLSFQKSEATDGYLIKDGVFMGYFGKEKHLVIPDGVTQLYTSDRLLLDVPISVRIPSTVTHIQKENMFNNYNNITIYIPENTVVESGAFTQKAPIVRY
jgi:hypothetical protein